MRTYYFKITACRDSTETKIHFYFSFRTKPETSLKALSKTMRDVEDHFGCGWHVTGETIQEDYYYAITQHRAAENEILLAGVGGKYKRN